MNKKLFGDFITWLKKPNPETTLVKLWQKKRTQDREKFERERPANLAYFCTNFLAFSRSLNQNFENFTV